jgi:predicted  nucleic acid-binding Zn-ribbon protein
MRFPFVPRAWHNAAIARLTAERNQLAKDLAAAEKDLAATEAELVGVSEKYTDTAIVNDCLTDDLSKARARLAEYGSRRTTAEVLEEHDVHRKALADALGPQKYHLNWDQLIDEVTRLNKAAHAWKADYEAEKKRADHLETDSETGRLKRRVAHLQRQLDDAVGLPPGRIEDSSRWQPGYKDPKTGVAS